MYKTLSAKYYQENKERLQKKACKRYQNLSKEQKEKKWQHGCKRYKNLSEDKKQKLVEYRKKYHRITKTLYYNYKKLLFPKNNNLEYKNVLKNQF